MDEKTCKNCFHYKACKEGANRNGFWDIKYTERECKHFLPTADVVEVKHGRWLLDGYHARCSVCRKWSDELDSAFCSNCGAKMDATKEK